MTAPESFAPPLERARIPQKLTPAGIQSLQELGRRRAFFVLFNLIVYGGLLWAAAQVFGAGGFPIANMIAFAAFAIAGPWTVLGFANAVIGFWLLCLTKNPVEKVAPYASAAQDKTPLTITTAVVLTIRNEDPARALKRLRILKQSLDLTSHGEFFDFFIMSDSDSLEITQREEAEVAAWKAELPEQEASRVVYRRRTANTGFKAGNIRDFCERWGSRYELMLTLDADSLMSGETVVELVRIMEAHPRIGILQSLISGMPSASAFARIFQFGMRHGMRSYTMGQAWWTGDCGPYWGHNGLIRLRPFIKHCHLPVLPGQPPLGGHVLSHDQIEAAFMRRAGYEVRVLPLECGSWDENPPTIVEFIRRDLRWCQGNLQYTRLLAEPGLHPLSRFQLVWAILMFVSIPAWPLMLGLLPIVALNAEAVPDFPSSLAAFLYVTFIIMHISPKLAGFAEAFAAKRRKNYGGRLRLAAGIVVETIFSFLLGAVSTIRISAFIFGLLTGHSVRWNGQSRDVHGLGWRDAFLAFWPQMAFGLIVWGGLLAVSPIVFALSLPLTTGYALAVPFAVVTASPSLGRALGRSRLCGIPEEFRPVFEIEAARTRSRDARKAPSQGQIPTANGKAGLTN